MAAADPQPLAMTAEQALDVARRGFIAELTIGQLFDAERQARTERDTALVRQIRLELEERNVVPARSERRQLRDRARLRRRGRDRRKAVRA